MSNGALSRFHPSVGAWFEDSFEAPTRPQVLGWPAIAAGDSTLILAPTGSGKTLTAFLSALDRLMFQPPPAAEARCRVVYVSPLKALAVDVERNLRAPLAGISRVADARGDRYYLPRVSVRTGDTPGRDRARFLREPGDILITTPESLYLMLTSSAADRLSSVETVILDEIHALVPTKRGAHLALSLERLEQLVSRPLQRIGLSATQRPLEEVARFLGGAERPAPGADADGGTSASETASSDGPAPTEEFAGHAAPVYRPVTIIDASARKAIALRVQVPVEDMAELGTAEPLPSGPASQGPVARTIWSAIHPQLLALIHAHRSTLLFVNSRRLAERLAAALNELAGETLVRAHHGSLARAQRTEIEDLLKAGRLRGLVATSSLELGIDMGAIDLVVQVEAPPSVASGLQRVGRAGHRVNDVSSGVVFPKFRGDLVACAAISRAMVEGDVEPSRYPRNPLDVLAQQLVAMTAVTPWHVDALFATVRQAAPFATLSRRAFDGVLDMLAGRYPSDHFAELRPRITWDRLAGLVTARDGAQRVAIANAGTIPDRGLYGVFLAGGEGPASRVGELDEEMVFEASPGDTFLLGASTWRITEITHDRVLVTPAPGEPGRMPFWRGETGSRPIALGRAIGRMVRELRQTTPAAARARLEHDHGLDATAADNLLQYLADQAAATGEVPDDRTVVIERCPDELGDWRVCVLSPLGSRVHAPWAMAVTARIRERLGLDVETMWSDDGFVVRWPEGETLPDPDWFVPDPEEVEPLLMRQLGSTALFAARFREAAGRALLLPRRRPGARAPLWQQRKRAADLLAVASQFGAFPLLLETYRECLRDVFDLAGLTEVLTAMRSRRVRVVPVESRIPSPYAASLLFNYAANYLYDGDAPLAERRAQALAVDPAQLRELIADGSLRELLDPESLAAVETELTHRCVQSVDAAHDLLLRVGDVTPEELAARTPDPETGHAIAQTLVAARRAVVVSVGGEPRLIAVEDMARYRDALGTPVPPGLPAALLEPVADPLGDLVRRYARTHGPFQTDAVARRLGLGVAVVETALRRLAETGRIIDGEFRPGGHGREWCDVDVLRAIRRRSLAALRRDVEPVDGVVFARFLVGWHGLGRMRRGLDALLDVVEQLQGVPLIASLLEREILPARVSDYTPAMLDTLIASGEVQWVGLEPLGERDGRIALFLTDHLPHLRPPAAVASPDEVPDPRDGAIEAHLARAGASFFDALHTACGGGFPQDTVDALWRLVWQGRVTNDALHPLRARIGTPERQRRGGRHRAFRSRRLVPPSAEGRWSLVCGGAPPPSLTAWATATAQQLLTRHGVVTRDVAALETLPGGYSAVYPVLKRLEETGRVRRGYFVAGLGAAQFAQPGAVDLLRAARDRRDDVGDATPVATVLAATDPANPYGAVLPWPEWPGANGRGATRSAGARVILVEGAAAAWLARGLRVMLCALPADEPDRGRIGRAVSAALARLAHEAPDAERGCLLEEINGRPAHDDAVAPWLRDAGFVVTASGLLLRVPRRDRARTATREAAGQDDSRLDEPATDV